MSSIINNKTSEEYWNHVWKDDIRLRLPSKWNSKVRNIQRLLKIHIKPGMKCLEIGCAPGKILSWVAAVLHAEVAGIDSSQKGFQLAKRLFDALELEADLRCEDIFETSFPPESFDLVYSAGVIEHFDDPRDIVKQHVLLLKPGGKALIIIPNYGGIYGQIQQKFDVQNLSLHNLNIMNVTALQELSPFELVGTVVSYPWGRMSVNFISFRKKWPHFIARTVQHTINIISLAQPVNIPFLCPFLVLELDRTKKE